MADITLFIVGMAILSAGTYLMRLGGAKLGSRLALSERSQALLSDAATVLLFSVALATTFMKVNILLAWHECWASVSPFFLPAQDAADRGDYFGGGGHGAAASGRAFIGRTGVSAIRQSDAPST